MKKSQQIWWRLAATAVLFSSAVFTASAPAQDSAAGAVAIDLRPQWTAGQTARYEFWNRIEQTVDVQLGERTQNQSTTTQITGEITWIVERVADYGTADCTMQLDWMLFEVTSSARGQTDTQVIDSRKPSSPETKPMHNLIRAMAAVPVKVKVAPDGHILAIDGLDAMKNKTDHPDSVPSELDFIETASGLTSIAYAPTPAPGNAPGH
ncbi:MAG: DUF6263 family protein, partial [Planctomycetota bacterium]